MTKLCLIRLLWSFVGNVRLYSNFVFFCSGGAVKVNRTAATSVWRFAKSIQTGYLCVNTTTGFWTAFHLAKAGGSVATEGRVVRKAKSVFWLHEYIVYCMSETA